MMKKKVIRMGDFLHLEGRVKGGTLRVPMHELSLTQNILDAALKNAGDKRLMRVNLVIGQFSDEREEAIRFYWADLAKDTPANTAELTFQWAPAEMKCLECGAAFQPAEETSACPVCQSYRVQLLSGDDVRLDSIDVE
jgi:hydrogenase nickel incorporation protein HypA/HybF